MIMLTLPRVGGKKSFRKVLCWFLLSLAELCHTHTQLRVCEQKCSAKMKKNMSSSSTVRKVWLRVQEIPSKATNSIIIRIKHTHTHNKMNNKDLKRPSLWFLSAVCLGGLLTAHPLTVWNICLNVLSLDWLKQAEIRQICAKIKGTLWGGIQLFFVLS